MVIRLSLMCYCVLVRITAPSSGIWMNQSEQTYNKTQKIFLDYTSPLISTKLTKIVASTQNLPFDITSPNSPTQPTSQAQFLASSTRIQPSESANTSKIKQLQVKPTKCPGDSTKPGINSVYDEYKKIFREVKCFENFEYKGEKCMLSNTKNETKITATLSISQLQNSETRNGKHFSYIPWLNQLIVTYFSAFESAEVQSIIIHQSENISTLYLANIEIIAYPLLNFKEYISILISLFHKQQFSMKSIIDKPSYLRQPDTSFLFQFISNDGSSEGFKMKMQTKFMLIHTASTLLTYMYPFKKTLFCPMVVLCKDEISFNNNSQLCLITIDVCFDSMLYDRGDSVQVCMEDYFSKLNNSNITYATNSHVMGENKPMNSYHYNPDGILALVLIYISSLSLLITLVVYFICPELRSLPGKCIMFLSASLLMSHGLLLLHIQFDNGQIDNPVRCIAAGVAIHYAWLASFFWMSASSIQMFLQFGRFITTQSTHRSKRLLKYCLYTFGCPFLLIAANLGYSLASTNGEEYGYDLIICIISYPMNYIITFIIPLSLVTMKNIILFGIVCCRIVKQENIQSVKSHLNKSKIIVKLSCLTGSLWIVGFVLYWVRLNILKYVFISLSYSQGFFIMISFVCTRKVLSLLRQKLSCRRCKNKKILDNSQHTSM